MKMDSCQRLVAAYEESFDLLGFDGFNGGLRYVCEQLERNVRLLRQARSRSGLIVSLQKEPDLTGEQLDAMIKTIKLIPYQLRQTLPEAAQQVAKQLPRTPGGRPRAVKPEEYRNICTDIGALLADGVSLGVAQLRIAKRKGVGKRTIQRIWQDRKLHAPAH